MRVAYLITLAALAPVLVIHPRAAVAATLLAAAVALAVGRRIALVALVVLLAIAVSGVRIDAAPPASQSTLRARP